MKTANKKYIVMSLVFLAICLPVTFLLVFIAIQSKPTDKPSDVIIPTSFPVSYNSGVEVEVDPSTEMIKYEYALITDEDFILLKNEKKELYVNLDKKNWRNVSFSDNGELVAVLGETKKDVFDLFIYNIKTKKWTAGTQYSKVENGIQNYQWVSNTLIYFIQGESNDRWIHSYNYVSGEIIKLKKVDGDFFSTNIKPENIVIDNIDRFSVYDKDLKLLAEASKTQNNIDGDTVILKRIFADFGEKFYLANDEEYYEYNTSETQDKISTKTFEGFPLCQIPSSEILTLGLGAEGETVYKNNFEFQTEKEPVGVVDSKEQLTEVKCINDEIFFFINSEVYNLVDGRYNPSNILKNAKDFDKL